MDSILLNDGKTKISRISLGTWAFSGTALWGKCNKKDAFLVVNEALDHQINLFDTAEKYGDGESERILGEALKNRRHNAVIATKLYSDHLRHDDIIASVDASLKRLQTDYIDIIQIHWPNEDIPAEETFDTLKYLKDLGKIRFVSVCNHGIKCMERIKDYDIILNQMPYSLLWRLTEYHISPLLSEKNIPLWAYSPLAQGLLTGKFKKLEDVPLNRRANRMYSAKWNQGRHSDDGFEKEIFTFLDQLQHLCSQYNFNMPTLALNYLKNKDIIGSILIGARNHEQLRQNIIAYETDVPPDILQMLEEMSSNLLAQMGENADLWENNTNKYGSKGRIY